jgi:hypothetical protein
MKNIIRFRDIRDKHYSKSRLITRVSGVYYCDKQNTNDMDRVWSELVDQVIFVDYKPGVNIYDAAPCQIKDHCSELWRRPFVWYDGRVNPCEVDYLSTMTTGDLTNDSLSAIWTGESYQNLRARHTAGQRGDIALCGKCVMI